MLLQVKKTDQGLVARRTERDFDNAGGADVEELRPMLLGLAAAGGVTPRVAEGWTVPELLEGIRKIGVLPVHPKIPDHTVGWITETALFEDRTLMWLDARERRLAIQIKAGAAGVLVFDAERRTLDAYPDIRLELSHRALKLRGSHTNRASMDGSWQLDDAAMTHLSVWSIEGARLELGARGERIELVAIDGDRWRPRDAPRPTLPGLGWPPGIVRQTRAFLSWPGGRCPVAVGPRGLDPRSVTLADPVPETLTWEVEVDLVAAKGGAVVRTLRATSSLPVATAFERLRVEAGSDEVDVIVPGATVGALVLTGAGPQPRALTLEVLLPGAHASAAAREVSCTLEASEPDGRAIYTCPELPELLRTRAEPQEFRFGCLGQHDLGSVVVLPPFVTGRWHPTGPRAQSWRAEGAKHASSLVRPVVDAEGKTAWAPVEDVDAGPGIVRSRHDLRIGGRRRSQQLRLCLIEAPRLRRLEPWRPIRIAGADDYVEVLLHAPWSDGVAVRIWLPPNRPAELPCEEARPGQIGVKLPRGVAGTLGQFCARLALVDPGGSPGPWGWLHRTLDSGAGPWTSVRYDGDVVLVPQAGRLFVDLHGLCGVAEMGPATTRRNEAATVLTLKEPWPVDGLSPLGVDGAMLAPVQAATSTTPDGRQSHVWLQDAERDPIHLVLEHRVGGWGLADFEGPETERELLGSAGVGSGGLRWLPHQVIGFEAPGAFLVWRNRLLQLGSPDRPEVRFAGWIWRTGEEIREEGGPLGRFGLRLAGGVSASRSWEGREDDGFEWTTQPPAEVLAAPELVRAEERGPDPLEPLTFVVEIAGRAQPFTLIARKTGSPFDPMRLTLVEGSVSTDLGMGPLRVWVQDRVATPGATP